MKKTGQMDIEALRQRILKQHDTLLENYTTLKQVSNTDRTEMLRRLAAAERQMDRLLALHKPPTGQDVRVQKLHRELSDLRVYFGAPTGRPLEDRGVDFIAPYVKTLRLLFQISGHMALYVEAVRTELALLEYRLEREQECDLFALANTVSLCQNRGHFTHEQDNLVYDLGHYLLLIHALLMPLLFSREQEKLRWDLTQVYLELAAAFICFDCGPEEPEEDFCDAFILSMMVQLLPEDPTKYVAQRCLDIALWLWAYPLSPEQKGQVAQCYKKAREVLTNA